MKLFRKTECYTIVADKVSNFTVQRIADEFGVRRKPLLVRDCNGLYLITFWTKAARDEVVTKLNKECRLICDVNASNNLIFVITKKECA